MSLSAAMLQKMADKGLTLQDAIELATMWEEGAAKPVSAGAIRARRYRDRKAQSVTDNVTRDVTRNDGEQKRRSPTPPKNKLLSEPLKGSISHELSTPPDEKPKADPADKLSLWVDRIWEGSPSRARERSGKRDLARALEGAVRRGHAPAAIATALDAYFATKDATKNDGEFVKGVHRMVEGDRWLAFAVEVDPHPPPDSDPWPGRLREFQTNGFWNTTDWGPKPGKPGCTAPQGQLEVAA